MKFIKKIKARFDFLGGYFLNLPLFQAGSGFCLGILIFKLIDSYFGLWVMISFGVIVALVCPKPKYILTLIVFLLFSGAGMYRFDNIYGAEVMQQRHRSYGTGIDRLQIISNPQESGSSKVYRAISHGVNGKILLKVPEYLSLECGDNVTGEFLLERPPEVDGFDYQNYLASQGVFYVITAQNAEVSSHKNSLHSYLAHFRLALSNKVRRNMPEPHASLVAGLVWGERASMPQDFEQNLSKTGTTHIIAVSGFNVSLLVMFFLKLAGLVPRQFVVIGIAIFLFLFIAFVGFDNLPAFRAGVMGFTVLLSKTFGRKVPLISLLSVSALVLSLVNPYSIFSMSFQLSFLAMIGVVGLTQNFEKILAPLPKLIRGDFASTIGAIVMTSPITTLTFGVFSTVAPFVNMFILPIVSISTILSICFCVLLVVYEPLGRVFAAVLFVIFEYMIHIIDFGASLSFSSVDLSVGSLAVGGFYSILLVVLVEGSYRSDRMRSDVIRQVQTR